MDIVKTLMEFSPSAILTLGALGLAELVWYLTH